jgi:hypothetical protein
VQHAHPPEGSDRGSNPSHCSKRPHVTRSVGLTIASNSGRRASAKPPLCWKSTSVRKAPGTW